VLAGPFATAYDASLALKLDAGGLGVSNLSAKLYGGALAGLFELKNNDGTGLFSGQMTLTNADLARALPGSGLSGAGTFSASLSTSGKSVDAMVAALSGSGTASLVGLNIANLNPDAFPAFVSRADSIGRDIDAAKVAAFAPGIAGSGSFAAEQVDIAFTVAGGVLRAPPVKLVHPAATLTGDVSADLGAGSVSATGTITYQPGDEALVGSEPALDIVVEGPIGATSRSFDSAPLAQFLVQRALEKEQQRVEAMQAALMEKQRLRREVRYYAALQEARMPRGRPLRRKRWRLPKQRLPRRRGQRRKQKRPPRRKPKRRRRPRPGPKLSSGSAARLKKKPVLRKGPGRTASAGRRNSPPRSYARRCLRPGRPSRPRRPSRRSRSRRQPWKTSSIRCDRSSRRKAPMTSQAEALPRLYVAEPFQRAGQIARVQDDLAPVRFSQSSTCKRSAEERLVSRGRVASISAISAASDIERAVAMEDNSSWKGFSSE
jgi:hypothetical protein